LTASDCEFIVKSDPEDAEPEDEDYDGDGDEEKYKSEESK
jgi:hypothetical protein